MDIERLQELVNKVKVIEALESEIINYNTKVERAKDRYRAVVEIQKYMSVIAETVKDLCFEIDLPLINLYWLNRDIDRNDSRTKYHHLIIKFNKGYVTFFEPSFASELKWNNFCNLTKEEIYNYKTDEEIKIDFIRLIGKWAEIKTTLEMGIEKVLLEQISKKKIESNNFVNSCQRIMEFTV